MRTTFGSPARAPRQRRPGPRRAPLRSSLAHAVPVALAAALFSAGACNFGRQEQIATQVRFSLTTEQCDAITSPANGGGPMDGTLVAVAGAEFPPLTEFRPGVHPCAPAAIGSELLALDVQVPEGDKRAIALAVLGPRFDLSNVDLPETVIGELPLRLREPRRVFFGGGKLLDTAELLSGSVDLTLDPFINLVGQVTRAGSPAAAHLTFYLPKQDGACLRAFDTVDDPSILVALEANANASGVFFAPLPYRAVGEFCPATQGNEAFAVARTDSAEVALLVPGRAGDEGNGLEPGMLLTDVRLFLATPERIRTATAPVVTAIVRVPQSNLLKIQLSGYGLDTVAGGTRVPASLRGPAGLVALNLEVEASGRLGRRPDDALLSSYARIRIAGADKEPSTLSLLAFDAQGALDLSTLSGGDYELSLGAGVLDQFTVRFRR